MSLSQKEIDWDDAARKGAAKDRRILLTRIKQALAGRTLGDPADPRSCVSGAVVAVVLDGLHGWCITDGRTDRKPGEIGRPYSESRAKRALAYLQSTAAECCVAVEPFRSHGSPRNWRSICWSNLHAWCERLEAEPVVRRVATREEQLVETTGAERHGHRCGPHGSTGAERHGHRCGPHRSNNEDGPETVQTVPSTEPAERMSEADADLVETVMSGGMDSDFETTEAQRHGENSRRVTEPRSSQTTQKSRESVKSRPVESRIAKESEVGLNTPYLDAVRDLDEVSLGSPSVPRCLRGSSSSHQRSTINDQRSEIERLLKQLDVEAAEVCVNQALRHYSLDQIEELVRYAAGEAIGDCQAWEPGFVFYRLTRPPSDAQGPRDGWAKRRPAWMLAKARQAERELRERQERRQRAERDLRTRRPEIEAFWGPVIDRLYEENRSWMWGRLTVAEQSLVKAYGGFRDRGVRDMFLLAAIEGRFEE